MTLLGNPSRKPGLRCIFLAYASGYQVFKQHYFVPEAPNALENYPQMLDRHPDLRRRWRVRLFVAGVLFVLAHETIPWGAEHRLTPSPLTKLINYAGLWQRPWNMFAPDPLRTSTWISAKLIDKNNQSFEWSSPQWAGVGPAEKFYRFRYFNYFNCFESPLNPLVIDDLADHLQRTLPTTEASFAAEDVREVKFSLKMMRILLPQDGTLNPRAETYRMFSDQPLATQTYSP